MSSARVTRVTIAYSRRRSTAAAVNRRTEISGLGVQPGALEEHGGDVGVELPGEAVAGVGCRIWDLWPRGCYSRVAPSGTFMSDSCPRHGAHRHLLAATGLGPGKLEQAVVQMTERFHVLELQGALPLEMVGDGNLLDDPRGPGPVTVAPSSTACPDLACPSPAAMRIRVVFPQPKCPTKMTKAFSSIVGDTSSITCISDSRNRRESSCGRDSYQHRA